MSRANEIAIAYAKGLADAVRKKNTAGLFGKKEEVVVEPDAMGDTGIDDGTIDEILAAQASDDAVVDAPSAENEIGEIPDPDDKKLKKPIR